MIKQNKSESHTPVSAIESFDMMEGIRELFKYPRYLVSDGFDQGLEYICKFVPIQVHHWQSGENVWTWTIPLKEPGKIKGELKVGEYIVKGFGDETIIFPIHLCHVYMANDNLSGVAVVIKLIELLQRTPGLKHSYKFLFLPETIGTIAYLSRFGEHYKYGIVIDSVGTDGEIVTTRSLTDSMINMYIEGKTNEFLSDQHLLSANDERVLESVGIPSIHISRAPFKEYHTNKDTPDIIKEDKLKEALQYAYSIIKKIEQDFIPKPTYIGVPCLSKYGLWEPPGIKLEKIYLMLPLGLSISQIAKATNLPFNFVYSFVDKMKEKGLVC